MTKQMDKKYVIPLNVVSYDYKKFIITLQKLKNIN